VRIAQALCLLVGICGGIFQHTLASSLTIGLCTIGALALVLIGLRTAPIEKARRPWRQIAFALAWILAGYAHASVCARSVMAHRLIGVAATGAEFDVVAKVAELPKPGRLALKIERVSSGAGTPDLAGVENLRVGYYGTQVFRAGERWALRVKLRRPHGEVNPGGFDFERLAAANRIDAVGYIVSVTKRVEPARGMNAIRENLSDQIAAAVPTPIERALLQALAVGDTRGLSDADWDLMRASGITHLIAISGLHVTLLATLGAAFAYGVCWLLPSLTLRYPRPQVCALVGLMCAYGYALLAGFGVPAQRTLLMLAALLLGVLLKRVQTLWQGFALALAAVLLADPLVVLSPGACLSFSAVALLITVGGQRYPRPGWWRELVSAQALMTVGLLPLTLLFFAQASLAAPVANLLAVPLVSLVIVPLVLAASVLLLCGAGALATPLLTLSAGLWHLLLAVLSWLSKPALMTLYFAPPTLVTLVLALLGVLLLFGPKGVPMRYFGALLLVPMLLSSPTAPVPAGQFRLTLLDVGQGLSAIVQTRSHTLLFDAGPGNPDGANAGESLVVPSLRALGVRQHDMTMISHADADHAGGWPAVQRAFPGPARSSAAELLHVAPCVAGQRWQWDGVAFEVLHPNEGLPYLRNQSSCVLKIQGETPALSALLPGDIDETIEGRLLRTQAQKLPSSLLVAPHHGSAGSSSAQFLAAVQPTWVLYPVGFANRFDFPRAATRARVQHSGASELLTSEGGALTAEFDATRQQWHITSERELQPRWWR
jgi:competence protein ComEC